MNWFEKHLNLTTVIGFFVFGFVIIAIGGLSSGESAGTVFPSSIEDLGYALFLCVVSTSIPLILITIKGSYIVSYFLIPAMLFLLVCGWVLKRKKRSLAWLVLPMFLPLGWVLPLCLRNRSDQFMGEAEQGFSYAQSNQHNELLSYYEEEKKLRLIYEKVEQLFNKNLGKYEDAYFKAQKALSNFIAGKSSRNDAKPIPPMDIMGKIFEVREYFSHSASDIVKRKQEMRAAPSPALVMSSAWLAVYIDYAALRDPRNIVASFGASHDYVKIAGQRQRLKELSTNLNNSQQKAWKEEREFRERFKISSGEYQRIVENAASAVATDEWLRKLQAECP